MRTSRRARLSIGLVAMVSVGLLAPSGCTPSCPTGWGSTAKSGIAQGTQAPVVSSRVGEQDCFDRFVVEVAGPMGHYDVRYVSNVYTEGEGALVPLAGGAKLQVSVMAPAYNSSGTPTYHPANPNQVHSVAGFDTFRQVAVLGTFEGYSSWGVGVRAKLPMRAFVLAGPGSHTRLVIDVAHRW